MEHKIKRPIKRSLIAGSIAFITVLCLVLVVVCYSGYSKVLFTQYEDDMSDQLEYISAHIDVDDLERCIKSGKKSNRYYALQAFLDDFKEHTDIEFVYVIVPLNDNETDNIKSVIAGLSKEDRKDEDKIVELNSLTGNSYSSSTALKYLEAYRSGEVSFFEGMSKWGSKYTGVLPLYNTDKQKVAALCIDVNTNEIYSRLNMQAITIIFVTLIISIIFIILFIYWSNQRITQPIQDLEESVTEFAKISHMHETPDKLVLNKADIHTQNEVESLSDAVQKMSDDIREYAETLTEAEEASKQQSIALSEALEGAQAANRAKTAFLSNMSHEIRTPMNAIIGLDNIALHEEGVPETTREHLLKIGSSAEHLLGLINDILDMSRIESGRMVIRSEEFSLSKTIAQVNTIIGGQCRDKGLTYECDMLGEVDERYIGDDMKLRQILINILGNAVKFTPEGGAVALEIQCIGRFDDNATLRFTMMDTGIGMSPEYIPHLFDSFSQENEGAANKYGSTGLGMAITKNLIDLMHGDIRVESEKGKGTTFTVTLTLREPPKDASPTRDDQPPPDITALIIDPDPVSREHARLMLTREGIPSAAASTSAEAIDMLQQRTPNAKAYDLIMIDHSPTAPNGLTTTKEVRALTGPNPVILLMTSYGWDDIATGGIEAGADSIILKPLFMATLMQEYAKVRQMRQSMTQQSKAQLKGKRILIAEDVEINAEILRMILEERGMQSEVAPNGEQAVEMYTDHPEGYYAAILMDMRMPVMDGLEATGAIRAMERPDSQRIPIIAMTANAFEEDARETRAAGMNAHLTKPVNAEQLYTTLENLIEQ